jgi:cytochrome c oxidase subunit II
MKNTLKSLQQQAARGARISSLALPSLTLSLMLGLLAPATWAADMPGGPAEKQLNFQAPVTAIASEIYSLHIIMLVICTVIFVAVFGVMFYSIYAHRKSKGHKAATFHESVAVEIAWTIVPTIIVIGMAAMATKTVIAMKDTSGADITIKATGYQWKWGYDYVKGEGEGISFVSTLSTPRDQMEGNSAARAANPTYLLEVDQRMYVPVGKKIRILTTANDVIHAWWVPAFGVKQDAIPGFIRDTWFKAEKEGVYRGNCAELCGKEHGYMPIVVEVLSADKYTAWVAGEKKKLAAKQEDPSKVWTMAESMDRGAKVYSGNGACLACHQANGKGLATNPPLDGSKMVTGPKENQIAILLAGRGTGMPSAKQLSDTDIAAVITYTRNTWGNKTGEVIQPAEIKAARATDPAKLAQLAAAK